MSFSIPERSTLKGPNFIRAVFERGAGIPGDRQGAGGGLYARPARGDGGPGHHCGHLSGHESRTPRVLGTR